MRSFTPGPLASSTGLTQAIGALLTLAALAQWALAARLARGIPQGLPQGTARETVRFVLIVALSGSVLAATGVLVHYLLGSQLLYQGAVLAWLAQVSGMLLVTPLLLWRHPVLRRDPVASLVFPVACIGLGLTLVLCGVIGRTERRADVERMRANARTVGAGLRHQFDLALRDLQALQALYFKVDIDRADFDAATGPMVERSPWEVEFAWLPRVARSYRLAHESQADEPPILERNARGDWVPAGPREDYFPAAWLRASVRPTITRPGADAAADSQRGPALRRVRDLGEISMTVPQRHALDGGEQTAVIQLFAPVLATNIVSGAAYDPRLLRGVVAVTVDLSQMLERACLEAGVRDEELTVFDALDGLAPVVERHGGAPRLLVAAQARSRIGVPGEVHDWVPLHTAGGELVLMARPAAVNAWPLPSAQQGAVFGIGVVFTALLSGLMALRRRREMELRGQRDRLEAEVQERTLSLRNEIEVRRRTEGELLVAQEQAEGASRAKSMFLANMS
ncbi:MAG: CHASE domain-containing protein, partial [Burkholderiales bacterium]|nr:CHASE domain-containing protein [Burkholderiales bacterium]